MSPKILVVEDDKILRMTLSSTLSSYGITVITASNGEEGLQKALQDEYDLVLLDIRMPKLDGFEVLSKIREVKDEQTLPVILLTNFDSKEDIAKAKANKANDYLVKSSMNMSQVAAAVKKFLGEHQPDQPEKATA